MIKIIKKWGDSLVIRFSPEELKILDISEDDIVEFEIKKLPKKEVEK